MSIISKVLEDYPDEGFVKLEGFDEALIKKTLRLVNLNEYKRNQFCPIIRVSTKAFGVGRRLPIVAKYLS